MTDLGFENFMNKLKDLYGEKHYPQARSNAIGRKLKILDDITLHYLADDLIANSRYAPMLDEILKTALPKLKIAYQKKAEEDAQRLESWIDETGGCEICFNSGMIVKFRKDTNYQFAFRCPKNNCLAAQIYCNSSDVTWSAKYEFYYLDESQADIDRRDNSNFSQKTSVAHDVKKLFDMVQNEKNEIFDPFA